MKSGFTESNIPCRQSKTCGTQPSLEAVHKKAGKTITARKMATVVKQMKKW